MLIQIEAVNDAPEQVAEFDVEDFELPYDTVNEPNEGWLVGDFISKYYSDVDTTDLGIFLISAQENELQGNDFVVIRVF